MVDTSEGFLRIAYWNAGGDFVDMRSAVCIGLVHCPLIAANWLGGEHRRPCSVHMQLP